MMRNEERRVGNAGKKTYSKPVIREVKLRPEEAVLGNCKISGGAGPLQSSCDTPGQCSSLGS